MSMKLIELYNIIILFNITKFKFRTQSIFGSKFTHIEISVAMG